MSSASDRQAAAHWARQLLADDFVILDTETTGLGVFDQVVQVAVIDKTGAVLLDTLVKPTRPIPRAASAIHGITDARVADAPTFGQIYDHLLMAIGGKRVAIYNKNFDVEMLHQSEQLYALECDSTWACIGQDAWQALAVWEDVMIPYSDWVGEWSEWHGSNRWQKLPGGDHTALGDVRACLAVLKQMAGAIEKPTKQIAWFADSPDAGHPTCICSWCGAGIGEHDAPPIRIVDSDAHTEARFHRRCASESGALPGVSFPEDDRETNFE